MTVRVDTLDAILTGSGSPSRIAPVVRSLSTAALGRLSAWWQQRSTTLVMSDEWMQEYRWSSRDRD